MQNAARDKTKKEYEKLNLRNQENAGGLSRGCALRGQKRLRLEDALLEFKEKYHILEENLNEVLFSLDADGYITCISPAAERLSGYRADWILGKHYMSFIHPEDLPALMASFERAMSGRKEEGEFRIFQNDGSICYVRGSAWLVRRKGQLRLDGYITDVTNLRKAEEALRWLKDQYRFLIKINPREMGLLSEMGGMLNSCLNVDEAHEICVRYMQEFFPNTSGVLCLINKAQDLAEAVKVWGNPQYVKKVFRPDDCWSLRNNRQNLVDDPHLGLQCGHIANPHTARYLCTPLVAQKKMLGVLFLQESPDKGIPGQSFNEHRQRLAMAAADHLALAISNINMREAIRQQSIRDLLTGLFSQRYMEETLERELCRSKRKQIPLGVLMFEIDYFNNLNELLGKEGGDALLCQLGTFLAKNTRGGDIVCRYGDAEFVVVLIDADLEHTFKRAKQLHQEIGEILVCSPDLPLDRIKLSIGVAAFPEHGPSAGDILRNAAYALNQAKTEGRDRVVVAS